MVEVKKLIAKHNVSICYLLETRVKQVKLGKVVGKMGRQWKWAHNYSFSHKGRIWVGWNIDYAQLLQ